MHISSTLGSKKCLGAACEVPSSGFPMHRQEETMLTFIYPTSCQTQPAIGNAKNQETALTAREAVIRSWLQKNEVLLLDNLIRTITLTQPWCL
jgi:hypothetical protein